MRKTGVKYCQIIETFKIIKERALKDNGDSHPLVY